jgi:hypothetical protein
MPPVINFLNLKFENGFEIKITMILEYLGFYLNLIKPSAGLPNLVRQSL